MNERRRGAVLLFWVVQVLAKSQLVKLVESLIWVAVSTLL